jgi:hypothetical protein
LRHWAARCYLGHGSHQGIVTNAMTTSSRHTRKPFGALALSVTMSCLLNLARKMVQ